MNTPNVPSHEIEHTFGLADQYNLTTFAIESERSNNPMGDNSRMTEKDLDQVARRYTIP